MIQNKLLEQAQERMEREDYENAHMKLYYNLIKNGKTSREAKRYLKKKYNFIVK